MLAQAKLLDPGRETRRPDAQRAKLTPPRAERARERLSERARGARLMVTPIYARKGRLSSEIGAHTHAFPSCRHAVTPILSMDFVRGK